MSDNPGGSSDEEKIKLGLIIDETSFAASADGVEERIREIGESAAKSFDGANESFQGYIDKANLGLDAQASAWDKSTEAVVGYNQELAQTQAMLDEMRAGVTTTGPMLDNYRASTGNYTPGLTNPQDIGYGQTGGQIGPEAPPDDADSVGSLSGVARGLRGVSPGGASVLYLVEGFRRLSDIIPTLNAAIEATPGILAPLVEGFTAMGVEMAGLAALALPIVAVGVAIAGVVAVLKALQAQADATSVGLSNQIKNEADFQKITSEDSDKGIADLQDKQKQAAADSQTIADATTGKIKLIFDAIKKYTTDGESDAQIQAKAKQFVETGSFNGDELQVGAAQQAANTQGYKDADEAIKQAAIDFQAVGQLGDDSLKAMKDGSNKVADAAVAQAKADDDLIQKSKDAADKLKEHAQLDALNTEQANKRIELLKGEAAGLTESNRILQDGTDKSPKVTAEIAANNKALAENAAAQKYLTDNVLVADKALDDAAALHKAVAQSIKDQEAADKALDVQLKASTQAIEQEAQAEADSKQKEAQAEEQYTQGSLQDIEQRSQIALKESRQETQIKQQTADAIADISTKLRDNEAKAANDLVRQQQDDTTKYNQTRSKTVLDEQDTEQQDLTDHLRKLADIKHQDAVNEQDDQISRNFRALFQAQQAKTTQEDSENERYSNQIADLRSHLKNTERDQDIAYQQEEQKRRVDANRKLEDLELAAQHEYTQQTTNEQRKLTAQQTAEKQQLQDLTTTENYKIQLLRQGLKEELDLLKQQETDRLKIIGDAINQLTNPNSPDSKARTGQSTPRAFANGGSFGAGEPFMFNEAGSGESVDIGSGSFGASGAALVYPLSGGRVNPNGASGGSASGNTFNIYESGNPARTKQQVLEALQELSR